MKSFKDLFESTESNTGFYCEVLVKESQFNNMLNMIHLNTDILLEPTDYKPHITLMYDETSNFKQIDLKKPYGKHTLKEFEVFSMNNRPVLVVTVESKYIVERHKELTDLGFKHSFSDYKPHVTLGYILNNDFNENLLKSLNFFKQMDFKLTEERIDIIRD